MLVPQQRSLRYTQFVIPAGKRVSSAMDDDLKYIHVVWIPAIPYILIPANKQARIPD
ncbi:MAG: hypothetical protein LUQ52_08005 [Methylococcaceae bacterium]|nr:hypothetical protein [Methylococcaceae bacterium]